jgi:hypothetical protein
MGAASGFLGGWSGRIATVLAVAAIGAAAWEAQQVWSAERLLTAAEVAGGQVATDIGERRARLAALADSIDRIRKTGAPPAGTPVVVISLADNRLWVHDRSTEIFTTRVASGSGRTLLGSGRNRKYKFDTPRGKLTVLSKETTPAWVPPEWHFVEQAGKRGLGILRMQRGQEIRVADGVITTRGSELVKRHRDGSVQTLTASDGKELVAGGRIIIPPGGNNARRYKEVLGTHRLNLGDGYALHGTNAPNSIGRSVSHGCVRLRNEDIETLYRMIPIGASVYIY